VNISYRPALSLLSSDYFKGFIYGRLDQVLNSSELSVIDHIKKNPELNKYIDKQKHIFDPNTANKSSQNPSQNQEKFSSYDPQKQYLAQIANESHNYYGYPSVLPQGNISYLYPSQPYIGDSMAQPMCNPLYDYNIASYNWFKDKACIPNLQQYQPESFYNVHVDPPYMPMEQPIQESNYENAFQGKKNTSFSKYEPNKCEEGKPLSAFIIR
jgi:hypothetical protein